MDKMPIIMMIFLLMISFTISMALLFINILISMNKMMNREKNSSFECGFDPMSDTKIPFSIQFFMISMMFLIFDIEISILIPLISCFKNLNTFTIISFFIFLSILIISIYLEYLENMIEWKK